MTLHQQFAEDLALFALGTLPENESVELIAHLADCRECNAELDRLRQDVALLALSSGEAEPPAAARQRFLDAIHREPRLVVKPARRFSWPWVLVPSLAALILAVLFFYALEHDSERKVELAALKASLSFSQADAAQAREMLSVLTAPDATRVTLVEGKSKPQPQGKAVYVARTGRLVFLASNLNPLPPGKAYELWLIPANGAKPIPAGVFKPDKSGNATMIGPALTPGTQAKAFAITAEPESGSDAPTSPILMVGTS